MERYSVLYVWRRSTGWGLANNRLRQGARMSERANITAKATETKREMRTSRNQERGHFQSASSPVDYINLLQRTIGNQAVQRMFRSGFLQAKLNIGKPKGIYEEEADRIAGQIMGMPEHVIQSKPT